MVSVLFVCLGNICRSPSAEGVFRNLVKSSNLSQKIIVDSAGTSDWHIGKAPDPRAQLMAKQRNIDLQFLRARQIAIDDFSNYDYVIAMDNSNKENLLQICPDNQKHRVHLFLDFTDKFTEIEVPDPYYGGDEGFEHVFDMIMEASRGLLDDIQQQWNSQHD